MKPDDDGGVDDLIACSERSSRLTRLWSTMSICVMLSLLVVVFLAGSMKYDAAVWLVVSELWSRNTLSVGSLYCRLFMFKNVGHVCSNLSGCSESLD